MPLRLQPAPPPGFSNLPTAMYRENSIDRGLGGSDHGSKHKST